MDDELNGSYEHGIAHLTGHLFSRTNFLWRRDCAIAPGPLIRMRPEKHTCRHRDKRAGGLQIGSLCGSYARKSFIMNDWRRMQSRANRSPDNSLLTGKITGNFSKFDPSCWVLSLYVSNFVKVAGPIASFRVEFNRELSLAYQEIRFP